MSEDDRRMLNRVCFTFALCAAVLFFLWVKAAVDHFGIPAGPGVLARFPKNSDYAEFHKAVKKGDFKKWTFDVNRWEHAKPSDKAKSNFRSNKHGLFLKTPLGDGLPAPQAGAFSGEVTLDYLPPVSGDGEIIWLTYVDGKLVEGTSSRTPG